MVWGGLIRIFLFQHVTFSINSICHTFGSGLPRPRREPEHLAARLPRFGESWHNGHHAFPASARHGLGRGRSTSPVVIRGLEKLGLVWDVKLPSRPAERRRAVRA